MGIRELGQTLKSAILWANPNTEWRLVYHNLSDYYTVKLVALELSGGHVGEHRPNLENLVNRCQTPEDFVRSCSGLNFTVPSGGKFIAAFEELRKKEQQNDN